MTKEQIIELISARISDYALKEMNMSERLLHAPKYTHTYDALLYKHKAYGVKREELQDLLDAILDTDIGGDE